MTFYAFFFFDTLLIINTTFNLFSFIIYIWICLHSWNYAINFIWECVYVMTKTCSKEDNDYSII